MKLRYDKETDTLVFSLRSNEIEETEEIRTGVLADLDKDGNLVSLEVLNASKKVESLHELVYGTQKLAIP